MNGVDDVARTRDLCCDSAYCVLIVPAFPKPRPLPAIPAFHLPLELHG
jgi:hypothetical protein